ncbi:lipopolysaccharide biosynthesis protein [Alteromonas sp. C1M14]|uniref:lipopolysaccharide biosynthesis protein n=1 Tax=Alteromonas sp. C1M14 TaxID=2841567 RepID=UPI001C097B70|nr:lipopolysaccharide biosynthesis protein [Alteromonas sp. C1M14]MBU2979943.1 lipopolysaccharide biosynthesis protein [Alteromonas sp. C1M14]
MKNLLISLFSVGFSKVLSAFSGLALTILVTNTLSAEDAGYFLFIVTLSFVLSVIYRQGSDNLILREFNLLEDNEKVKFATTLWSRILAISIIFSLFYWFLRLTFLDISFSRYIYSIDYLSIFIIPLTLLNFIGFIFQSKSKFIMASFCQTFAVNIIFIICVLIISFLSHEVELKYYYYFYILSTIISLTFAIYILKKSNVKFNLDNYSFRLRKDSETTRVIFYQSTLLGLVVQWGIYFISVLFLNPSEIAVLSACNRFAFVLGFILTIVNTVSIPLFVKEIKKGANNSLREIACSFSFILASVTLPLIIILFIYSKELIGIFGEHYEEYFLILQILLLGQLGNVLTGSVGYLLNLSGNEKDVRQVSIIVTLFILVSAFPSAHYGGLIGVSIAISLSILLQNLSLFVFVRYRLGFWLVPILSRKNINTVIKAYRND